EQQAENIRKMLLAMSVDIRVIIIKLADRLHNMRTLDYMRPQKRRDKALETLEIYAPIAHRLGIRAIKEELEDLAISYLDPIAYQEISDTLDAADNLHKDFIDETITKIQSRIDEVVPGAHIDGRIKSIHGIYRKMYIQNRNFDEIYDIYAIRIIVESVIDCYNCLGVIHDMFHSLPGRFKDYISTPKSNMYQSLHTTVICEDGIPFEVQIRTWEMHYTAEYGIAAHWKYKLGLEDNSKFEERLTWIRQLLESQNDSEDVEDIVRAIKSDFDVFVFTPKGDVINVPQAQLLLILPMQFTQKLAITWLVQK
ncbi:MAG: HD domain-containing protein, partial [Oscillospiraceae bacterium]